MPPADELSPLDVQMLDFERNWWKYAGSKDEAIRRTFDMNVTRYYQRLNVLLASPAALRYDAQVVRRLQRIRDQRRGPQAIVRR